MNSCFGLVYFVSSTGDLDLCIRPSYSGWTLSQYVGQFRGSSASSDAHSQEPLHRQPDHLRHDVVPDLHAVHPRLHPETPVVAWPDSLQARTRHPGRQHHGVRRDHHCDCLG